jgi:hypothetical protein
MIELSPEQVAFWIEKAGQGDVHALAELQHALHPALKGHIQVEFAGATPEVVEEIASLIWEKVRASLGQSAAQGGYDPSRGSFYTYVTKRIGRFIILQERRKDWRRRRREQPLAHPADEITEETTDTPDTEKPAPDELAAQLEEKRLWLDAFVEVFRLTFLCGGYPHQQLAFGYSKLIYGRAVQGSSKQVDQRHGAIKLQQLTDDFLADYQAQAGLDPEHFEALSRAIEPVRKRNACLIEDLVQLSPVLRDQLETCHGRLNGNLSLRDFYTRRGFSCAIPDWCSKVEHRVRASLGLEETGRLDDALASMASRLDEGPIEPAGCSHCKLRNAPPCGATQAP